MLRPVVEKLVTLAKKGGRNRTMIVACALLGIGSLFTAIPNDIFTFNVFRIVGGVGVGLCSVASPLYISETSPSRLRGGFGIMFDDVLAAGYAWLVLQGLAWLLL